MKTVFLRALEDEDKAATLLAAIHMPGPVREKRRFDVDPATFAVVPHSPFAYWVSERLRQLFSSESATIAPKHVAWVGLQTNYDFRWLRLWWECPTLTGVGAYWVPFAKGGICSPYYADIPLSVAWGATGRHLKEWKVDQLRQGLITANNSRCWNESQYFRRGLTWPRRTNGLSLRAMPANCVFGDKGPALFVVGDFANELLALAAVTNSQAFGLLVSLQLARTELAQSYEVGLIQRTPVPDTNLVEQTTLANLAGRAWSLKRLLDTRNETSRAFGLPALLQSHAGTFAERSAGWSDQVVVADLALAAIRVEIDARCFDLYGIDEVDRQLPTASSGGRSDESTVTSEIDTESDVDDAEEAAADAATLTAELVSWAVGVAFGRFDVRLATGARALPPEPEPFDALPVCSPAMLTGDDGLPLSSAPPGYPLKLAEGGILVDDPGHPRDLTAAVRAVFDVVFGADADARFREASALLDPKEQNLRNWLSKGFFEQHLKRHSRSRRKAPIVWQLATASSSYSIWLYAHRVTKDTFFQVQRDLISEKLAHEERAQAALEKDAAGGATPAQRKEIAAKDTLVEELRTLLDETKRIAALWQPDLDDGVVLTMAPLFRLVPQHKPWQKELKAAWDGLAAGKFDWAHLAMHLWPERVVPKCATDRSLAIAHGLEDVFWIEATEGKWKARPAPTRSVDDLVRDRTSPAVKASLKSLVEAPIVGGGGAKRGRKPAAR